MFDCILEAGLVARGRKGFDRIKDQVAGESLVGRIRAQRVAKFKFIISIHKEISEEIEGKSLGDGMKAVISDKTCPLLEVN